MQNTKKSGIYCIENTKSNKKYIGQSVNIEDRWRQHISELNKGIHYNSYLQNAWNKYGSECFDFYILEYCNNDELDEKECYYIKKYNTTDRENGYNLQSGGQASNRHSEESKKKISESNKKAYKSGDLKKIRSESALKQWANPEIKAKITGSNNGMYGKHHSVKARMKMSEMKKGKPSPHRILIPVLCIELEKEYNSAAEAAKEMNIQSGGILSVCRGSRKTCGGYHWKFLLENNVG